MFLSDDININISQILLNQIVRTKFCNKHLLIAGPFNNCVIYHDSTQICKYRIYVYLIYSLYNVNLRFSNLYSPCSGTPFVHLKACLIQTLYSARETSPAHLLPIQHIPPFSTVLSRANQHISIYILYLLTIKHLYRCAMLSQAPTPTAVSTPFETYCHSLQ